jgi:hypothetical protein
VGDLEITGSNIDTLVRSEVSLPLATVGHLGIKHCPMLASFKGLSNLATVGILKIEGCGSLASFEGLSNLAAVGRMTVGGV